MDARTRLTAALAEHQEVVAALGGIEERVLEAAARLDRLIAEDGHLLICGNGGSAADSQHWAGEWRGKLHRDRRPLRGTALTVDSSTMTAIANDYGYDEVFARQVRALGRKGDVLVAISTSGDSANVLKAAAAAREIGMDVIGLTGEGGGKLADACDVLIAIPSRSTQRIQEAHGLLMHAICDINDASVR